ncbi:MAG: hypothetical protein SVY53_09810 [Chloroflexota bacterium]|nr:hypothetical protein [Chloroflexota bacterium]
MQQSSKECVWISVQGILQKGYRVASGQSKDSPYPRGSIEMQTPFFLEQGIDLRKFYPGTLNISISPYKFNIKNPSWTLYDVVWFNKDYPETFSFSECILDRGIAKVKSLLYYPHPETKPAHYQDESTIEVLAPFIKGLQYGHSITLLLNPNEIDINQPNQIA